MLSSVAYEKNQLVFFCFTVAAIVGFLYLHLVVIALASTIDQHTKKLVQIVEHISRDERFSNEPLKDIFTGDDLL